MLTRRKLEIYSILKSLSATEIKDFDLKGVYTFLSYYSISIANENDVDYTKFTKIGIDGIGLVLVWRLLFHKNIKRLSFDNTSVAKYIFSQLNRNAESLSIIGSERIYLERFLNNVKTEFKEISINIVHDGFFDDYQRSELLKSLAKQSNGVLIIGMGTKYQDKLALDIWEINKNIRIFTCGGFIHQSSSSLDYYPEYIDRFNLRVFYRLFKEKGMWNKFIKIIDIFIYPIIVKFK